MKAKHIRSTTLPLPAYQTEGAAGMDLYADGMDLTIIQPGGLAAIPTNVAVEIPEGFEGQVRGRSGLAFKAGILGYVGTIDSDYRGEIKALLFNAGDEPYHVHRGDRIAQLVISPVARVTLEQGEFSETARGTAGFGSTGIAICPREGCTASTRCFRCEIPSTGHRIWDANRGPAGEPTKEQIEEWADSDIAYRRVFGCPYPLGGDK